MHSLHSLILGTLSQRPRLFLALRVGLLFATFVVVDHFMRRAGDLSRESYEEPYLVLGLVDRLGIGWLVGITILAVALARYGLLLDRFSVLDLGAKLRAFIVFLAALTAWPLVTYGHNYYFDQGYYVDRALLALLVPLIGWRPVFVYPFLLLAFPILGQLAEPTLGYGAHFPHTLQVLLVLTLFAAFFFLHAISGSRRVDTFFFLTCCIVASAYWAPGFGKVRIAWITHGHLYRMLPAAYAHGWLSFLEPQTIVTFAQAIAWVDWPMRVFALATEIGFLFFFWRRSVSLALLVAITLFHVATFAVYGYLFWIWIALDIAILVFLVRDRETKSIDIYTPSHFVLSILLIAASGSWARPPTLAWFDTRLSYTYRYEAIGVTGKRYTLPPRFFAPYGDDFTMANFSYLVNEHRILVAPYGITVDRERAERLMDVKTAGAIFSLESELGADRYDPERTKLFLDFIRRYLEHWNSGHEDRVDLSAVGPPPLFWSFPRGEAFDGQEEIRELIVKEVTSFYDDESLETIRVLELARIDIRTKASVTIPIGAQ